MSHISVHKGKSFYMICLLLSFKFIYFDSIPTFLRKVWCTSELQDGYLNCWSENYQTSIEIISLIFWIYMYHDFSILKPSVVYVLVESQEHLLYRYFYRGFLVICFLQTGFKWQAIHWYGLCGGASMMCGDRGFAQLLLALHFVS